MSQKQMDKTGNGQMNDSSSGSSRQPKTLDKGALVFERSEVTQVNKGKVLEQALACMEKWGRATLVSE